MKHHGRWSSSVNSISLSVLLQFDIVEHSSLINLCGDEPSAKCRHIRFYSHVTGSKGLVPLASPYAAPRCAVVGLSSGVHPGVFTLGCSHVTGSKGLVPLASYYAALRCAELSSGVHPGVFTLGCSPCPPRGSLTQSILVARGLRLGSSLDRHNGTK